MSAASEELAKDNCSVSDEVVQLREDKASQAQNMDALQVQATAVACLVCCSVWRGKRIIPAYTPSLVLCCACRMCTSQHKQQVA